MLYQNSTPLLPIQLHSPYPKLIVVENTKYGFYKQKMLGQGFGGTIYEGRNIVDSSPIAVKILNPNSLIQNHIPLKQLIQLTSKNHIKESKLPFFENHLVEVIDVIQMDKAIIVMQLCEYNLSQFVSYKKPLSEPQILEILKNIIQALLIVQNQGYHFSDLKPQNILITKDGSAKLGDLESLIMLHKLDKNVQLKFHNSIFGTLHYMPPQLIGLGQHSSKNYIWSLGVILHEIIYGLPPFEVEKYEQNLTRQQKVQSINVFYQKLFNLKICQTQTRDYPKCHLLLIKMLRFNAKNRIELHKILDIISDQSEENSHSLISLDIPQVNKSRSNSQNTIDTADEHKNQLSECSIKLQNKNQKWKNKNENKQNHRENRQQSDQKHQNQKQTEVKRFYGLAFHQNKYKGDKMVQFYQKLKQIYEQQTMKLIKQIQSPVVLVRKLNHFHAKMANLLQKLEQVKESKNMKDHRIMVQSIWHEIKASKVYTHLETTMKIQNLQMGFERNYRQVNLWRHLNELIEMARAHLISFETQVQTKFHAN